MGYISAGIKLANAEQTMAMITCFICNQSVTEVTAKQALLRTKEKVHVCDTCLVLKLSGSQFSEDYAGLPQDEVDRIKLVITNLI